VIISPAGQQVINMTASCQCQVPSNTYTIRDTIPNGFSYVSSTGGVLNGNVVSFSSVGFATEQESKNFSITLQANSNGCFIDSSINDNRTVTIGGLTSAATLGTTQWTTSTMRSKSPTGSWLATTPTVASDFSLTSSAFTVGSLSVLSFWHYFVTENTFDGGTVELSVDNGSTWTDAGPYMMQNGYNSLMDPNTPWTSNQKAFSGVSYAQGSNQFINTVINLSSFSGQNMRVRFRMRTDAGNPAVADGWFIDDILLMNGCGGIIKAGLYNASNVKIDSSAYPVYIRSNGVPTNIQSHPVAAEVCPGTSASFSVAATGGTLTYQWQVSTNGGTSYTDISGANGSTLNVSNVASSMNGYLYRCIVDNGSNSATSSAAQLNVASPTAAGTIANVSACEGSSLQVNSNATGTNLSYLWQISTDGGTNYSNISGGTTATLFLNNVVLSQNGALIRVVVNGTCGSGNSTTGTLTVNSKPVVTITNPPTSLCTSDPAVTLSASQAGGVWTGQGMNGDKFSPAGLTAGTYTVSYSVANSSGCTGVATANIVVTNCADRQLMLDAPGAILIASNPNDGKFRIIFNTERYAKLKMNVYASDGKLVNQQNINGITYGMSFPVNLFHLASDVYQLSLYDEVTGNEKTFRVKISR